MITFHDHVLRPIERTLTGPSGMLRSFGTVALCVMTLQIIPEVLRPPEPPNGVPIWQWVQIAAVAWTVLRFVLTPLVVNLIKKSLKPELDRLDMMRQSIVTLEANAMDIKEVEAKVQLLPVLQNSIQELKHSVDEAIQTLGSVAEDLGRQGREISELQGYQEAQREAYAKLSKEG